MLDSLTVSVCGLHYLLSTCLDFSKFYSNFSFQKVHPFKEKIIKTTEKEPDFII